MLDYNLKQSRGKCHRKNGAFQSLQWNHSHFWWSITHVRQEYVSRVTFPGVAVRAGTTKIGTTETEGVWPERLGTWALGPAPPWGRSPVTPGPLLPSPCKCPQMSNEGFGENDPKVFPFSVPSWLCTQSAEHLGKNCSVKHWKGKRSWPTEKWVSRNGMAGWGVGDGGVLSKSVGNIDRGASTGKMWTLIVLPNAGKNHLGVLFLLVFCVCFLIKKNETTQEELQSVYPEWPLENL